LGGWIATNASGMKKNRYGNIEDIVLDVNVVTAAGKLQRTSASPRESVGLDLRRLMFGSRRHARHHHVGGRQSVPRAGGSRVRFDPLSVFRRGIQFMKDLVRESTPPASVRLVDNLQFQFGLALKPKSSGGLADLKSKAEKFFVTKVKGFDPYKMVACTLVFEGGKAEVEQQQKDVYRIAARNHGMKAGAENGRRGYHQQ
jgi:alkyldihydroxyacetonephosphate synthase